jgi:hypothetical protein
MREGRSTYCTDLHQQLCEWPQPQGKHMRDKRTMRVAARLLLMCRRRRRCGAHTASSHPPVHAQIQQSATA